MSITVTKDELQLEASDEVRTLEITKAPLTLEVQRTDNALEVQKDNLTLEVQAQGTQGPKGDPGTQGADGADGADGEGDKYYTQTFLTTDTVVVTHNLGKFPSIVVFDSANDEVEGNVTHDSINQLTAVFSSSFSGRIVCN